MSTPRRLAATGALALALSVPTISTASAQTTVAQNPGDSCALSQCDTNWRAVWEGVKLVTPGSPPLARGGRIVGRGQ